MVCTLSETKDKQELLTHRCRLQTILATRVVRDLFFFYIKAMALVHNIFSRSAKVTLIVTIVHDIIAKTVLETGEVFVDTTSLEYKTVVNDP